MYLSKLLRGSLSLVILILILGWSTQAFAQRACPPLDARYQNRDYLDPAQRLGINTVERVHFNDNVRMLRGGARGKSSTLRGDLDYTLNAIPNHHSALETMVRLALREGTLTPLGMPSIECRFQWAMDVNPRDGMVHMIHAQYRLQVGQRAEARNLLELAGELEPNNANLRYNVGLLYFRLNDYENALAHARDAYALGFPLPGLRNMLERAGYSLGD